MNLSPEIKEIKQTSINNLSKANKEIRKIEARLGRLNNEIQDYLLIEEEDKAFDGLISRERFRRLNSLFAVQRRNAIRTLNWIKCFTNRDCEEYPQINVKWSTKRFQGWLGEQLQTIKRRENFLSIQIRERPFDDEVIRKELEHLKKIAERHREILRKQKQVSKSQCNEIARELEDYAKQEFKSIDEK